MILWSTSAVEGEETAPIQRNGINEMLTFINDSALKRC